MLTHQLLSFRFNVSSTSRSSNENGGTSNQSSCILFFTQALKRWRTHFLIDLFKETSEIMCQNGTSTAITPLFFFRISISILGVIIGGNTVYLIQILNKKIHTFSPTLYYILMMTITLIGPDLFFIPPITPLNACAVLKRRLKIVAVCLIISPSFKAICITSGLWHIDRGDFHHRKLQNDTQGTLNENEELYNMMEYFNHRREEELVVTFEMINSICLMCYHFFLEFRAMFGVGMIWAGYEIYSCAAFLWAMAFYIVAQVIMLLMFY